MPLEYIIPAAASVIGDFIDFGATNNANAMNLKIARETNQANMELAKYQNEANVALWREQSDYNNPTNTMQRLVDAGINPRAYNQLGQFANAASPPQMQRAEMKGYQYRSPLSAFSDTATSLLDNRKKVKEIELLEAQRKATLANAGLKDAQKNTEEWRTEKMYQEYQKLKQQYEFDSKEFNLRMHKLGITEDENGVVHFPEELKGIETEKEVQIVNDLLQRIATAKSEQDVKDITKQIQQLEYEYLESIQEGRKTWNTPFIEFIFKCVGSLDDILGAIPGAGRVLKWLNGVFK